MSGALTDSRPIKMLPVDSKILIKIIIFEILDDVNTLLIFLAKEKKIPSKKTHIGEKNQCGEGQDMTLAHDSKRVFMITVDIKISMLLV